MRESRFHHTGAESNKKSDEKKTEHLAKAKRLASFAHYQYSHDMNSHTLHIYFSMKVVVVAICRLKAL